MKAGYEVLISELSGEIEQLEIGMETPDDQLAKYKEMEQDAKTLAQDHALTSELIGRLIERMNTTINSWGSDSAAPNASKIIPYFFVLGLTYGGRKSWKRMCRNSFCC